MDKNKYSMTRLRIVNELANLNKLDSELAEYVTYPIAKIDRIKGVNINDTFAMRAITSIISDYYMNVVRILLIIYRNIDGANLEGKRKMDFTEQMKYPIEGMRPAVISDTTYDLVDKLSSSWEEFKGSYGYNMSINKIIEILEELPNISKSYRKDLESFLIKMGDIQYGREEN